MSKIKDLSAKVLTSDNWNSKNTNYNKKDVGIDIFTAFELPKDDVDKIIKLVSEKYNFTPYPINVILDKTLIGGVKIVFDSKVIDSSILAKLNYIKNTSKERN